MGRDLFDLTLTAKQWGCQPVPLSSRYCRRPEERSAVLAGPSCTWQNELPTRRTIYVGISRADKKAT